jgi:hypothetical protein
VNGGANANHIEPDLSTRQSIGSGMHDVPVDPDISPQSGKALQVLVHRTPADLITAREWHVGPPKASQHHTE